MTLEERFDRIELQIEKNTNGIRDLIVVSRTLVDSQQRTDAQIKELRNAQQDTDAKLNALIDTVDRIVRHRNGTE